MRCVPVILMLMLGCPWAHAADLGTRAAGAAYAESKGSAVARTFAAVTATGAGQAGYVHYFLITHPNGDLEYQVGIELDDQRIAWSFPEAGVMVSEFIKRGAISVKDSTYKIEHLYGLRPFARDADMRLLQRELPRRVAQWVDDGVAYCLMRTPGQPFCLSCGDFVVRILFPGTHPLIPALPSDFLRAGGGMASTDDLLLYLTGLYSLPDSPAMRARLVALDLPAPLRDDLRSMIERMEPEAPTVAQAPAPAPVALPASTKPASGRRVAIRRTHTKKL